MSLPLSLSLLLLLRVSGAQFESIRRATDVRTEEARVRGDGMLSFSERAPLTEAAAPPHRLGAPGSENESNSLD